MKIKEIIHKMAKRRPLLPGAKAPTKEDIARMKEEVDMKNAPSPTEDPFEIKPIGIEPIGIEPVGIQPLETYQVDSNEELAEQIKELEDKLQVAEEKSIYPHKYDNLNNHDQPKKPAPLVPPTPQPKQPEEPTREKVEEPEEEVDLLTTAKQIMSRMEELQFEQMRMMTILRRLMEGQ